MKRSSSLVGAVLVGLSVTTASVAFAAPPPAPPVLVAQAKAKSPTTVQPSDPTPAGGGADPTAAPTTPASTEEPAGAPVTEPPATVAGPTVPGIDAPGTSPAEPPKVSKRRPWAGTQIFAATTMTTATISKGQQQAYNPTVDTYASISPDRKSVV